MSKDDRANKLREQMIRQQYETSMREAWERHTRQQITASSPTPISRAQLLKELAPGLNALFPAGQQASTASWTGSTWRCFDSVPTKPVEIQVGNAAQTVTLWGKWERDMANNVYAHQYNADRSYARAIGGAANGPGNIALLNRLVVTNYYATPSKGVYWHTGSKVSPSLGKYPETKKPMHRINIMEWERKVTDIAAAYEAMVPDPFLDAMNNRYVKMFWEKLVNSIKGVDDDLVVRELSNARCMYRGLPNETASLLLRAANTPITVSKMNDGHSLINSGLLLRIPPIPQYRKTKGTLNLSGLRVLMNWAERPDFKRFFDCFIPDPIELERTIMSNQVEAKMKTGFWADDWR